MAVTEDPPFSQPLTVSGDVERIERWMLERGVPHLVKVRSDSAIRDAWTRALPLLVVAYLLLGLNALDLRS